MNEVETRLVDRVEELLRMRAEAKPGVSHALAFFEGNGIRRALASSSLMRLIRAVLARLGLESTFEVVHSAADEPRGKPHPAVFLTTARRLGVDPLAAS